MLKALTLAVLLALSGAVHAQAGAPPAQRRFDCSKAKDPKACEERLAKAKERAAARAGQRARIREACKDKKGEELRSCLRDQRKK